MSHPLAAKGISAAFLPDSGFLTDLSVTDQGTTVAPMHRAPWLGQAMPAGSPPHHARLQGDFFCAPFGDASADDAPLHGWRANGHWTVETASPPHLTAILDRPVMGARVVKTLSLRAGHPFVYQNHAFEGGAGRIGAANHAMVSLPRWSACRPNRFSARPRKPWNLIPHGAARRCNTLRPQPISARFPASGARSI